MPPGHRRPFKQVSLAVTGAQSFEDRFPDNESHDDQVPKCSTGQQDFKIPCNVTGLSHVYNLYFVAYLDKIYVYEPQFPNQTLQTDPALIIETDSIPLAPEDQARYPHFQHIGSRTINRLLVQLLGNQEIVAVVRDDGDVEAYYTRQIHDAIENRADYDNTFGVLGTDVKPFFHRNVGRSAWGLAVHSTARMIAVSANTFETTVFTFALTDGESDDEDDDLEFDDGAFYYAMRGPLPPNDRRKNDVRILSHAKSEYNLPDIAFCNTGHDPTGRWLLTADLLGQVAAWDIHTLQLVQVVNTALSPPPFVPPEGSMDFRNGLWGLMFLDPSCFRTAKTPEEALGISSQSPNIDLRKVKEGVFWDLGKTIDDIEHVRRPFVDVGRPVEVKNGNYADPLEESRQPSSQSSTRNSSSQLAGALSGPWHVGL